MLLHWRILIKNYFSFLSFRMEISTIKVTPEVKPEATPEVTWRFKLSARRIELQRRWQEEIRMPFSIQRQVTWNRRAVECLLCIGFCCLCKWKKWSTKKLDIILNQMLSLSYCVYKELIQFDTDKSWSN